MKLVRRLSDEPASLRMSRNGNRCPDVWETDTGDYVIVGQDVTAELGSQFPADTELDTNEKVVLVPKAVLESAIKRINNA